MRRSQGSRMTKPFSCKSGVTMMTQMTCEVEADVFRDGYLRLQSNIESLTSQKEAMEKRLREDKVKYEGNRRRLAEREANINVKEAVLLKRKEKQDKDQTIFAAQGKQREAEIAKQHAIDELDYFGNTLDSVQERIRVTQAEGIQENSAARIMPVLRTMVDGLSKIAQEKNRFVMETEARLGPTTAQYRKVTQEEEKLQAEIQAKENKLKELNDKKHMSDIILAIPIDDTEDEERYVQTLEADVARMEELFTKSKVDKEEEKGDTKEGEEEEKADAKEGEEEEKGDAKEGEEEEKGDDKEGEEQEQSFIKQIEDQEYAFVKQVEELEESNKRREEEYEARATLLKNQKILNEWRVVVRESKLMKESEDIIKLARENDIQGRRRADEMEVLTPEICAKKLQQLIEDRQKRLDEMLKRNREIEEKIKSSRPIFESKWERKMKRTDTYQKRIVRKDGIRIQIDEVTEQNLELRAKEQTLRHKIERTRKRKADIIRRQEEHSQLQREIEEVEERIGNKKEERLEKERFLITRRPVIEEHQKEVIALEARANKLTSVVHELERQVAEFERPMKVAVGNLHDDRQQLDDAIERRSPSKDRSFSRSLLNSPA